MYIKLLLKILKFKAKLQKYLDENHDGCRKCIEIIRYNQT